MCGEGIEGRFYPITIIVSVGGGIWGFQLVLEELWSYGGVRKKLGYERLITLSPRIDRLSRRECRFIERNYVLTILTICISIWYSRAN